jgi:hypothetical protein
MTGHASAVFTQEPRLAGLVVHEVDAPQPWQPTAKNAASAGR